MMIITLSRRPPAKANEQRGEELDIAICCFRTQAVRVVEFVRRELEPDDMCIRIREC